MGNGGEEEKLRVAWPSALYLELQASEVQIAQRVDIAGLQKFAGVISCFLARSHRSMLVTPYE